MAPASSATAAAPARRDRLLFTGVLVLAGLAQLALFSYATAPGLAGTSDSRLYLHAAHTLRETGQLLNPDGTPYRYWPPLYPVLLAVAGSLPGIRMLHGACLLGSLLLWSWLGRQLLPTRRAVVLPILLALSTPWLLVSKFVWSESLFILLFAAYAACLFHWLRSGLGAWWLAATVAGFFMPLERTLGLFLLAGIGGGLVLGRRYVLSIRHWLRFGLHLALSTVGGVWWQWYALHAGPSRYHPSRGWDQLLSSAADYGFVLGRWLLLLPASGRVLLPSVVWALLLLALFWGLWPRSAQSRSAASLAESPAFNALRNGVGQSPAGSHILMLQASWSACATLVALVAVLTLFAQSAAGIHDAERYASVLFGPVMLLVLAAWPARVPRWLSRVVVAVLLVFAGLRVGHVAQDLRRVPSVSFPEPAPHGQRVGATGKQIPNRLAQLRMHQHVGNLGQGHQHETTLSQPRMWHG